VKKLDNICPVCGESAMKHWNQGIYECEDCGAMIPLDDLEELI
jgi:ribosomal protein L37AE/L43A